MRVFVLGAGFSKPAKMPLAVELTESLIARATMNGENDEMKAWCDSLQKRLRFLGHGMAAKINIEEFFHYAQFDAEVWRLKHHLAPVGRNDGQTFWRHAESIETWLSYLLWDLVDEIWEKQQAADLEPIRRWAQFVRPDDVVVTFNYDTLVEQALNDLKFPWSHGFPEESNAGVTVLKIHGSIDWQLMEREAFNKQFSTLLFRKQNSNLKNWRDEGVAMEDRIDLIRVSKEKLGQVIANRDFNERYFGIAGLGTYKELHKVAGLGVVWSNAAKALAKADQIVVIGFAMTPFDAMVRLVFANVMMNKSQPRQPKTFLISPEAERLRDDFAAVFPNVIAIQKYHEQFEWGTLDAQ